MGLSMRGGLNSVFVNKNMQLVGIVLGVENDLVIFKMELKLMIKLVRLSELFSFNLQITIHNLNSFHTFKIYLNSRKDN